MCAFADTTNKSVIRTQWDAVIIEHWKSSLGRPLSYFGLPGPEVKDLLDWKTYLSIKTGVESIGKTDRQKQQANETISRLYKNIFLNNLSSEFQLLRGDIEDIIINAVDIDGNSPRINDGQPAHIAKFHYDIVNLDFDGGLGYLDMRGGSKRVDAIKRLFERQEGHNFILFLTINVRHTLGSQIDDYLKKMQARERGNGWHELIEWHLNRPKGQLDHKLKATVLSFVQAVSELRMFSCTSHPPIVYEGHEKARMVHFAFEFTKQSGNLKAFSIQDDRDLVEMPLLESKDGRIRFAELQYPEFDFTKCDDYFNFLPREIADSILSRD